MPTQFLFVTFSKGGNSRKLEAIIARTLNGHYIHICFGIFHVLGSLPVPCISPSAKDEENERAEQISCVVLLLALLLHLTGTLAGCCVALLLMLLFYLTWTVNRMFLAVNEAKKYRVGSNWLREYKEWGQIITLLMDSTTMRTTTIPPPCSLFGAPMEKWDRVLASSDSPSL